PPRLARLAMRTVAAAVRAVLHQLEPVRVVPPVLAGDVVAVLALLAGQGDLGPHIGGSHEGVPFCFDGPRSGSNPGVPGSRLPGGPGGRPPGPAVRAHGAATQRQATDACLVAEAGLEPATQRL